MSDESGAPAQPQPAPPQLAALPPGAYGPVSDLLQLYRIAFGRQPDSEAEVLSKQGLSQAALLREIFTSAEFRQGMLERLETGRALLGGFAEPPSVDLCAWAARYLPLTDPGRERVSAAVTWPELYFGLVADLRFRRLFDADDPLLTAELQAQLRERRAGPGDRIDGAVDVVGRGAVGGWAVDLERPDRQLTLELRSGGRVLAAARTGLFRREVEDRVPGGGRAGFLIQHELRLATPVQAEVRIAGGGARIGAVTLPAAEVRTPGASRLASEIEALSLQLEQLRAQVRSFVPPAWDLDDYAGYRRRWYPRPAPTPPADQAVARDLAVLLHGDDEPSTIRALESLRQQSVAPGKVVVPLRAAPSPVLEDAARRLRLAGLDVDLPFAFDDARRTSLAPSSAAAIALLGPGAWLSPDALERVLSALRGQARPVLVSCDSDEEDGEGGVWPRLLGAFDLDRVQQQGWPEPLTLVDAEAARACGCGFTATGEAATLDVVLRLAQAHPERLQHLPRVLAHRSPGAEDSRTWAARREVVERRLWETEPAATVAVEQDALAPQCRSLRVRRSASLRDRSATVIIPTRDRLDLLEPCFESLQACRDRSRTAVDVVIVDNGSTDPETLATLARWSSTAGVAVLRNDAPFNWALLNNVAAETGRGDVLIFLNNDTLAAREDWIDALCEHALREEVGAVGARLLYEDGTLQHVGQVLGDTYGLAAHESVGAPGDSPGYLGRNTVVRQAAAVTGACMATRRAVFGRLGGFDSAAFPREWNDLDYCLRVRAAGLKVLYTPHAVLYHLESKSRGMNVTAAQKDAAMANLAVLRERWPMAGDDPFYNGHFSREAQPFTALGPPPPLD